jgi:hypothetical protein
MIEEKQLGTVRILVEPVVGLGRYCTWGLAGSGTASAPRSEWGRIYSGERILW